MGSGWWSKNRQRCLCSLSATAQNPFHPGIKDTLGNRATGWVSRWRFLRCDGEQRQPSVAGWGGAERQGWVLDKDSHPSVRSLFLPGQLVSHTDTVVGVLGQRWTNSNTAGSQSPCWGLSSVLSNPYSTSYDIRGN